MWCVYIYILYKCIHNKHHCRYTYNCIHCVRLGPFSERSEQTETSQTSSCQVKVALSTACVEHFHVDSKSSQDLQHRVGLVDLREIHGKIYSKLWFYLGFIMKYGGFSWYIYIWCSVPTPLPPGHGHGSAICGVVGVWYCPPLPPVVWWGVCLECMVWHVWNVWYVWYVW